MKRLNLYYITDDYVNYLRSFDNRVFYNKNATRPYVGVVFKHNDFYYFAPLASPKAKHKKISSKAVDVYKIDDGNLGIVNINNMIPTPKECLTEAFSITTDDFYKNLLKDQLDFLNKNKYQLMIKVKRFMEQYRNGKLSDRIMERCCDFKLLEAKCLEYKVPMNS